MRRMVTEMRKKKKRNRSREEKRRKKKSNYYEGEGREEGVGVVGCRRKRIVWSLEKRNG